MAGVTEAFASFRWVRRAEVRSETSGGGFVRRENTGFVEIQTISKSGTHRDGGLTRCNYVLKPTYARNSIFAVDGVEARVFFIMMMLMWIECPQRKVAS